MDEIESEIPYLRQRIFWWDRLKGALAINGVKKKDQEVYMYRFREAIKTNDEAELAKIVDDVFEDYCQ